MLLEPLVQVVVRLSIQNLLLESFENWLWLLLLDELRTYKEEKIIKESEEIFTYVLEILWLLLDPVWEDFCWEVVLVYCVFFRILKSLNILIIWILILAYYLRPSLLTQLRHRLVMLRLHHLQVLHQVLQSLRLPHLR